MMYCKYIPCVTIISGTPGAAYKASLRVQSERSKRLRELPSAGTHRPLSQGVPSSKTVHWTVFEFTPGTRDCVRSISPSADGEQRLCLWTLPPLKRRAKLCRSVPRGFYSERGLQSCLASAE